MASGSLNKVMLIGNTGDEVKMHYFDNSSCLGRFPLATSEEYVNKSTGERISNTEWHTIIVRNKAAEICEKYLKKGDKVYIEGRIKTKKWTDDRGNDRYTTEIHCSDFKFLTPKEKSSKQTDYNSSSQMSEVQNIPVTENDGKEDDLPF